MRFNRFVTSAMLVCGVLLSAAWGCGGGSTEAKDVDTSKLAPAPDLSVLVNVQAGTSEAGQFIPNVKTALTTSLTSAGYKLVDNEEGKPDVIAKVTVNATEEKSLFQVQVGGKVQVSYAVKLSASFVSAGEASVIDQATSDFSSGDGTVEQSAIDKILVHLSTTGKLATYAKTSKEKAQKADEDKKAAEQKAEDDLWKAANVEGCRKPTAANACEGVEAYIAKYPSGKYTAEGRQAMLDGKAESARMAEEDMWKAAAVDQCKKPTKSYDCKAVEEYLAKYPTGAHAADAKAAMKSSEKAREDLKKKEDALQKKASREDCIKECRRSYERAFYFEVLVNRCIQTECK
jgi:hypothetical protein